MTTMSRTTWQKVFPILGKRERDADERERMARIEDARRDLDDLKKRKDRAVGALQERHARNHWSEAVRQTIQGAH